MLMNDVMIPMMPTKSRRWWCWPERIRDEEEDKQDDGNGDDESHCYGGQGSDCVSGDQGTCPAAISSKMKRLPARAKGNSMAEAIARMPRMAALAARATPCRGRPHGTQGRSPGRAR